MKGHNFGLVACHDRPFADKKALEDIPEEIIPEHFHSIIVKLQQVFFERDNVLKLREPVRCNDGSSPIFLCLGSREGRGVRGNDAG